MRQTETCPDKATLVFRRNPASLPNCYESDTGVRRGTLYRGGAGVTQIANPSVIICTAADSGYFGLLQGLMDSLAAGPMARTLPVGILDLGLLPEQRDWLKARGAILVEPHWDLDFPGRATVPTHYRAMTARPFLPRHFPGHDVILWLDADTWVQDDSVLPWFIAAAAQGKLAIVPELDRGYWTMFKPPKLWGQNQKAFAWGYGMRAGYRLGRNPILNSGAFALAANAPHWALWAEAHRRALHRRRLRSIMARPMYFFIAEQTALNYVVFGERQPHTFLPAIANWFVAKGHPKWDAERGLLVEPHAPYRPLGVVHLAGANVKERVWSLATLDGGTVELRTTWAEANALRQGTGM